MRYMRHIAISILILIQGQAILAETTDTPALIRKAPEKIEKIKAPFKMPQLKRPVFRKKVFNISQYGAKGDGKTKNTEAFRKAIEACTSAGGGKVLVPKGKWFTGPIHLKSNVNLHFEEGAELHFSDDPKDYLPVVFTRWAGFECYNYSPLIYARDCENIAMTGPGKLFPNGRRWWGWAKQQLQTATEMYENQVLKGVPPEERIFGTPEAGLRPQTISPINCRNVLLEGFTIVEPGPFWTMQAVYCENLIVRDIVMHTRGGPNTDGINLDSTRNALIEYCILDVGDDAVCLKSGINEDGWRVGRPTENVVVRHITALHCHGGIVIGSEMSGGVRNVFAHDCVYEGSQCGIRLKSNSARGGVVENIYYHNIRMSQIERDAIRINTNYGAWLAAEDATEYPVFRNIVIRDVICEGAGTAVNIQGSAQQPIEGITMENVHINSKNGMNFDWVCNLKLINVSCTPSVGDPISLKNSRDVK